MIRPLLPARKGDGGMPAAYPARCAVGEIHVGMTFGAHARVGDAVRVDSRALHVDGDRSGKAHVAVDEHFLPVTVHEPLDDFGTGYSSLSVLREFPVGEIKIDRSFINRELGQSDEIIIRSIIDMAYKLNIDVITEGVEQVEQKDFLHRLGCDRIQGFLYDQPLPKDKFEERMKEGCYKI